MKSIPFASTIVVLALLFSFAEQGNDGITRSSFVFGNSSYTFHKNSPQYRNWEESRELCKNIGSDLVSIESEKEWTFLKETIQKNATIEYFIGLKKERSGQWRWISDHSKVNDTIGKFPWAQDEPSGDPNGNCAVMYKDYRKDYGLFNDLSCSEQRHITGYICESSVNSNDQQKVPTVKQKSYRTEGESKGSGTKTTLRESLTVTSAARIPTSNSPSTEAPSKATPPKNVKDVPIKDTMKNNTKVIIIIFSIMAFLALITLIVFYAMYVRRRKFKKQVQSRVSCTYQKPSSSPGQQSEQQSDEQRRHLESSAAEVTVHVTLTRTEAGLDTYETIGEQEGPTYATVKQTNKKSLSHREGSLTHGERTPKKTQSEDGYCIPLESLPLDATNKLEAHGVVDVKTVKKFENKDHVYEVVHKENQGRDSAARLHARTPCLKNLERALTSPSSAVERANRLSSADPVNHTDARCSSAEPVNHSQDALPGDEKKDYLYAVVDKTNKKK